MTGEVVRIGMLGASNVGAALVKLIVEGGDDIAARTGLRLQVTRVAVGDVGKPRPAHIDPAILTGDSETLVTDPDVDIVVETMGGIEPARTLILAALKAGKPVVTANKALLATTGTELIEAASIFGVDLLYEAAVGSAIPLIRPLRESLAGERITRIMGIVNGTTNYILTRMTEAGADYAEALAEAQELGYAELDPTADVEGFDAAAKISILASIAFGSTVVSADVHREGMSGVTADDIAFAGRLGYVIKLLAIAESSAGQVGVRVHPAMVPKAHPLAAVREAFNAVFIEGEAAGELMLYGRGAGGSAAASAVLGDVIDAAHNLRSGSASRSMPSGRATIRPMDEVRSEYYLSLEVADRPGVLAQVAGVFGDHGVSIRSMEQQGMGEEARLVFITHTALERDVQATLADLRALDAVDRVGTLLRVAGEG